MRIIYTILLLAFVFQISCISDKNPISSDVLNSDIWPLKLNNTWYYQSTWFDSLENPRRVEVDTHIVCCDTIINGIQCYKTAKLWRGWHYNDDQGLWLLWENGSSEISEPSLHRKYPCEKGDKFGFYEVISIDTLVNVIYGKVTCILYKMELGTNESYTDFFMKPGIGTIKSTTYHLNSRNEYIKFDEYELVDYKL